MVTCAVIAWVHLTTNAGRDVAEISEAILRTVGEAVGYLQHIQGMVGRALDSQSKRWLVLGHLAALLLALGVRPLPPFTSAFWPLLLLSGCSLMLQAWLRSSCSQVIHAAFSEPVYTPVCRLIRAALPESVLGLRSSPVMQVPFVPHEWCSGLAQTAALACTCAAASILGWSFRRYLHGLQDKAR